MADVPLPQAVTGPMFDPTAVSGLDKTRAEGEDIQKRWDAERAPLQDQAQGAAKELQHAVDQPVDKVPLPENKAQHLDPKQLSDSASSFMALGAIAGLLTRRPMTSALKNMTAAVQGIQEGDDKRYKEAFDRYKTDFDKAMATNKAMIDEKEKVLKDKSLSLTAIQAQMHLIDTKYGNEVGRNSKDFKSQMELMKAQQTATEHAQNAHEKIVEFGQREADRREDRALRQQMHSESLAARADGTTHTGTLDYKLKEIEDLQKSGRLSPEEAKTRKSALIAGGHETVAEQKAAAQNIQLSLANKEIGDLSDKGVKMPLAADIHIDGNGAVSAVGRLGQKKALSEDEQKLVAAAQLYAEAAGHIQSGARLTQAAFNRAMREFIPQPGDKPGTLAEKREHRDALVRGGEVLSGRAGAKLKAAEGAKKPEATSPAAPYSDAEKEKRYQEWKAKNGGAPASAPQKVSRASIDDILSKYQDA